MPASDVRAWLRSRLLSLIRWVRITAVVSAGALWRPLMFRTTYIAITGSVGKTTAKECTAAALARVFPVVATKGNSNSRGGISRTLLRTMPWHRYAVVEVGIEGPGQMERSARFVRPHIAVWLSVARTHTSSLRTLEQTAAEKSKLIDSLPPGGIAVLNADDPYVARYTPPPGVKVIRFGTGEDCDIRAVDVRSPWPERLSFTLRTGKQAIPVATRLVGKHWVPSVLAALAVAQACEMDLKEAAAGIAEVEPFPARLSPALAPNGAVFLRDEYNGSIDTLDAAFTVVREATAERKILVISNVTNDPRIWRQRFAGLGRAAAADFDVGVFITEHAHRAVKAAMDAGMPAERLHSYFRVEDAARFLQAELRPGDLVLVRGTVREHLERIFLSMTGDVVCWRPKCSRRYLCDECPDLRQNPTWYTLDGLARRLSGE